MRHAILAFLACATLVLTGQAVAQSDALSRLAMVGNGLDQSITDPGDIAAFCGGDAALGEQLYQQSCAACHALTAEAEPRAGPHLYALAGRIPGSLEGFDYSKALRAAGTEGWVWEREVMHGYIGSPAQFLPGSHVGVAAMPDEQTRQHLFTYLRTATTPPPPARGTVVVPPEVLAMQGDIPYGEYLASECVACHLMSGQTAGVPAITGWPRQPFITAMFEYRLGSRPNQTMVNMARRLTDEEIVALADYFETIK